MSGLPTVEHEELEIPDVNIRVEVRNAFETFGRNFYVTAYDPFRRTVTHIGAPVVMRPHEKGRAIPTQPTFCLQVDAQQQLMDQLWRCGVRPSDEQDAGPPLIKQYNEHIADLKSEVAFGRDKQTRVFEELCLAAHALAHRVDPLQDTIFHERREHEQEEAK